MKILVLHHTDLDGAMSAAVVGMKYRNDQVFYKLYNYGWKIEPKDLQGYDLIYAVDISFFQGGYDWVYKTPGLIAIDHHIGAIKKEESPEFSWVKTVPGIRVSENKGACELTWEYLFPDSPKPELLVYLSTYDVWDKNRLNWNTVEEVEFGAKYYFGLSPEAIIRFIETGQNLEKLRKTGYTLLCSMEKSNRGKLGSNGFYIHDFYGYRLLALNTPDFSSMSFSSYYNPRYFDIMMPFSIVPDSKKGYGEVYVRASLYTENPGIDVSCIAERFGGSGHRGASGFTMSLETLKELLSCSCPLKDYLQSVGFEGNRPKRATI